MPPRVSVVIPAFNAERYIVETVQSALDQDYPDKEIIVVDDGSSDGTAEVLRRFGDRVHVVALEKNSGGPARPRNEGVRRAAGELIALFDADDIMLPGKLSEQVRFLDAHPDVDMVFSNFRNVRDGRDEPPFLDDHHRFQRLAQGGPRGGGQVIPGERAYETLIADTFIGTSSVVLRRSLFDAVGFFDESLSNSDDVDFFFRAVRNGPVGYVDRILHRRRLHGENISSRRKALLARRTVYLRQWAAPKSRRAEADLRAFLYGLYYAIGFSDRRRGRRLSSVKWFWEAWKMNKRPRLILAMLKSLVALPAGGAHGG